MTKSQSNLSYFKERVKYWQDYFGINDWAISVKMSPLDGAEANTKTSLTDRLAVITLNTNIKDPSEPKLNETALHEVMHVLLKPLSAFCSMFNDDLVQEAEHAVIHRLIKRIL